MNIGSEITLNNHGIENSQLRLTWLELDNKLSIADNSTTRRDRFDLDSVDANQTVVTTSNDAFIGNQHDEFENDYRCIGLCHLASSPLDIISITVEYTCQ